MDMVSKKTVVYFLRSNPTNPKSSHTFSYGQHAVELDVSKIREIILGGGLVKEILPDNTLLTLNLSNYYTENYKEEKPPVEEKQEELLLPPPEEELLLPPAPAEEEDKKEESTDEKSVEENKEDDSKPQQQQQKKKKR